MTYQVGIDLGDTWTAVAVARPGRVPPEVVAGCGGPTVVCAAPDGSLHVGGDAERHAAADPARVARRFVHRIGDATPLRLGGAALPAAEVAARFVARLLDGVAARMDGRASRVAVTHPAGWGPHRLEAMRAAMAGHGLGDALLVPDPDAAVLGSAGGARIGSGAAVAVYDLGGTGFRATVVRVLAGDRCTVLGRPERLDTGGVDIDQAVFDHVTAALGPAWDALDAADPAVQAAVGRLRRGCTSAKEALSADTDVLVPVALPGIETTVRLGRADFEELIRPTVDATVAALARAIESAPGSADELAAVLLVGGSARIPLVTQVVSAHLHRPVTVAAPGVAAVGAALAARSAAGPVFAGPVFGSAAFGSPAFGGPAFGGPPIGALGALGEPARSARTAAPSSDGGRGADRAGTAPADVPLRPFGPPALRLPGSGAAGRSRRGLLGAVAATVLAASIAIGGAALADRVEPPGAGPGTAPGSGTGPPAAGDGTTSRDVRVVQVTATRVPPGTTPAERPARTATQPTTRSTTRPPGSTTTQPTGTSRPATSTSSTGSGATTSAGSPPSGAGPTTGADPR